MLESPDAVYIGGSLRIETAKISWQVVTGMFLITFRSLSRTHGVI